MEAAPDLVTALAAVRAVVARFHTASDMELVVDVEAVEAIGRVVDGLRIAGAAQVEARSSKRAGEDSLAFWLGARDGVEAVQILAGVSYPTAKQRVGLGAALAPRVGLSGEVLPGRYPVLADAVTAGEVGAESARVIVRQVRSLQRRVASEGLRDMVESLTVTAKTVDTETVRQVGHEWALALDPDGAEPGEQTQRRKRAATLGRTLEDGTTTLSLVLTPEHLAIVKELLQSRRRGQLLFRTTAGGDDRTEETDPEWREEVGPDGERRTRTQQDYDTLLETLQAGIRTEHDGTSTSAAVTNETVVTITATELEARQGRGFTAGVMAGIPVPVVERHTCTGGMRLLVTGENGEALYLGRSHRVFTIAQKKALSAAAGGRCQFPGCRTPAPYLEAHHAAWWSRDTGPTDVTNGIMLCSFHHHLVHATRSPVEIRAYDGDVYVVPAGWRGEPMEHHRSSTGHPAPSHSTRSDNDANANASSADAPPEHPPLMPLIDGCQWIRDGADALSH